MADTVTLRCEARHRNSTAVLQEGDAVVMRFAVGDQNMAAAMANELNRQLDLGHLRLEIVRAAEAVNG